MTAQGLQVGDQMSGRVIDDVGMRRRAPAAALVEDDDPVEARVEETAVRRRGAGAGSAVQKDHGHATRIAGLLPVHDMTIVERQHAGRERLDVRIQVVAVVTNVHDEAGTREQLMEI